MSESRLSLSLAGLGEQDSDNDPEQLAPVPKNDLAQLTPEQLSDHRRTVASAVEGDREAVAELERSQALEQLGNYVARMIGGSPWDQAVSKEDVVHDVVCEVLSAANGVSVDELRNVLYRAARHNVIDIFRRQRVVSFRPLAEASAAAAAGSVQGELERRELLLRWRAQLNEWLPRLHPVDRYILWATAKEKHPREIACSLYEKDWTSLTNEKRKQLSDKVSRRLYKLKEKLAAWVRESERAKPGD